MLNRNSKKSWHSDKSWKHFLLFTFTHFNFIPFAFTLHYVLIKSLFDLEDFVVQILIWLNKKCGINSFWHPFMRLLVHSWLSIFRAIYMWGIWFCLHYSAHIYCWECYTQFQSDFHLLSDNIGNIWVEAYFQIEIQVYSKTKSIFGLATTFHSHWVLRAWEISLAFVVFLNLN